MKPLLSALTTSDKAIILNWSKQPTLSESEKETMCIIWDKYYSTRPGCNSCDSTIEVMFETLYILATSILPI